MFWEIALSKNSISRRPLRRHLLTFASLSRRGARLIVSGWMLWTGGIMRATSFPTAGSLREFCVFTLHLTQLHSPISRCNGVALTAETRGPHTFLRKIPGMGCSPPRWRALDLGRRRGDVLADTSTIRPHLCHGSSLSAMQSGLLVDNERTRGR